MNNQANGLPNLKIRTTKEEIPAEANQLTGESQKIDEAIKQLEEDNSAKVENLDDPYIYKNSVTIVPISTTSYYRKVNQQILSDKIDYIGSSITSSRMLTSNKEEMDAYMPNLVGISPNHDEFTYRVKSYFNNIRIPVESIGKTFDISFRFKTKRDYLNYMENLERIEEAYSKVNKSDIKSFTEALNIKIEAINQLESVQYRKGSPINVADYLMYRHCLLYPDIAKDVSLVSSDKNVRFYIRDKNKEAIKSRNHRNQVNLAKGYFVQCTSNNRLFNNVYIQYCVYKNKPVTLVTTLEQTIREEELDRFSTEEPSKFNEIFKDSNLEIKSMIELLVAKGELIRIPHSQNITTIDNELIGKNIKEAVTWFTDIHNRAKVEAYRSKLNY